MKPFAIHLQHVTKQYVIHHEKPTLVEKFTQRKQESFTALNDISLMIRPAERVGIIGPNGSGKTTLLKTIVGITSPTSGSIQTNGRIISLIDLSAGFHPDLSGYQNIFLNGLLLGMRKNEILQKIPSIIRFADIKQFIDTPLFTYSSGMRLRLGFAIAVHAQPDILILDEGLSVGDSVFQKKAKAKIQQLFNRKITIIIVSHNLEFLKEYCTRIILIRKGIIVEDGSIAVLNKYDRSS